MGELRDISTKLGHKESALRDALYQSLVTAATSELLSEAVGPPARALDIGCGRGELMLCLSSLGYECFGVDVEPQCVSLAGQFGTAFLGGFESLESLGFCLPGRRPQIVVSSHVLEHVDSPLGCLRSAAALNANRYVFSVPNVCRSIRLVRAIVGSPRADHPTHVYGWTRPEFQALLDRAGFDVLGWFPDRVTVNPLSGAFGAWLTRFLSPLETRLLPRIFPMLTSSLTAACQLRRQGADSTDNLP